MVYIFLLLTILFWGTTPVVEKSALNNTSPFIGLTIRSTVVVVILWIATLLTGKLNILFKSDTKTIILFSLSGILASLLGMLTYYSALKLDLSSRVVPLAATYPLISALWAYIFLGEQLTLPRIIGTILIITGILLVK